MKSFLRAFSATALLGTFGAQAQTFTKADVRYWVGSGPDSTVLVVDFHDGTEDSSYAWGYLHGAGATAEEMVNAIAAADANLAVDIQGGFLNSVTYNSHAGIGGQPDWWSTWSGTDLDGMQMNMGLAETLSNGSWFGCSYTDFNPALPPGVPLAAINPAAFTAGDVALWTGSGAHSAVLVVDFQDLNGPASFAWGFHFDGTTTGEAMLNAVAAADPQFALVISTGFLSDITYNGHAGIGGQPDWWSTWSATNMGNWTTNLGIGTEVEDGGFFGCSYTDFNPALRPGVPVAASIPTLVAERANEELLVYPQPATDVLNIRHAAAAGQPVFITDLSGQVVRTGRTGSLLSAVDVRSLAPGLYVLQVGEVKRTIAVQ